MNKIDFPFDNKNVYINDAVVVDGIKYDYNHSGFRTHNHLDEDYILFLGCSNTFGFGLQYDHVYPTLVEKSTKYQAINLGVSGASNDVILKLLMEWIVMNGKPKKVIVNWTSIYRMLYSINGKNTCNILFHDGTVNGGKMFDDYLLDDDKLKHFDKIKNKVEKICEVNKIKLYQLTLFDCYNDYDMVKYKKIDLAKDNLHAGPMTHQLIAFDIIQEIEDEETYTED